MKSRGLLLNSGSWILPYPWEVKTEFSNSLDHQKNPPLFSATCPVRSHYEHRRRQEYMIIPSLCSIFGAQQNTCYRRWSLRDIKVGLTWKSYRLYPLVNSCQLQGFTLWRSRSFCGLHPRTENSAQSILKLPERYLTVYSKDRMAIDVLTTSRKQSLRIKFSCSHGYFSWIEPIGAADQLG